MAELIITSHVNIAVEEIPEGMAQQICVAVAKTLTRFSRYPGFPGFQYHCTYAAQVTEGSYHEKDIVPAPVMPF